MSRSFLHRGRDVRCGKGRSRKMIRSMTGFGSAESRLDGWDVRVEVHSVNHKGLNVSLNLPEPLQSRENELQNLIRERISRGHVHLKLRCEVEAEAIGDLLDRDKLRSYLGAIKELADEVGLSVAVDPASLPALSGALGGNPLERMAKEQAWERIRAACCEALDALLQMKQKEGAALQAQLSEVCNRIEELTREVETACPTLIEAYQNRLLERVQALLGEKAADLDGNAICREVALCAERSDISEEIARLKSHLAQFREALQGTDVPVGRKLEFLAQEMLREANTIAAKLPGTERTRDVLNIKTEVDRLREQVRNVE